MERKTEPTRYAIQSRERIIQLVTDYCNGSQQEFADKVNLNKASVSQYINGKNVPSNMTATKIATTFHVNPEWVMGFDAPMRAKQPSVRIPVLGRVAAGIPLDAIEEIIDWEEIPQEMAKNGEYFGLKIKGNSMSPRIQNGDVVIVRKQDDADTDDIVIALVNGNEGCCKKLKKTNTGIMLISFNPAYDPMVFDKSEIDCIPVRIIGKVVELRGKF